MWGLMVSGSMSVNLGHAHTGESFRHQRADAADANDADSKVLDVPLCADAPGVYGAALTRIVFEAGQRRRLPVDRISVGCGDAHLAAPCADHPVGLLLPEPCAPVPVVAHGHSKEGFAGRLRGVGHLVAFGGDVDIAQILPPRRGVAVQEAKPALRFLASLMARVT